MKKSNLCLTSALNFLLAFVLTGATTPCISGEKPPEIETETLQDSTKTAATSPSKGVATHSTNLGHKSDVIYKSTDADGHVTYSDLPNPEALHEEQIVLPDYSPSESPEQAKIRLDKMIATTQRLQEDRRTRDKSRRQSAPTHNKASPQYPQVIVQNRVYRRPPYHHRRFNYPVIYAPYPHSAGYHGEHHHSSLGVNISGGSSKFRYGISLGSQQERRQNRSIRTPYRRPYGNGH